ncbi:ThuA domain-containing protein [Planctomicrobium sp. SH668]|uniref:ThuA domain-containing protein n=1 Tax=Planctomicrobium sp. SH668 TaxID=3448126 RepID=UPI003F5B063B
MRFDLWVKSALAAAVLGMSLGFFSSSGYAEDAEVKPLRALLVLGGCCHDYAAQQRILADGIEARAHVKVDISYDPDQGTSHLNPVYEKADWAEGYDVIIHDECTADVTDKDLVNRILDPHRNGLPAVLLHCAMHSYRTEGFPGVTPWFEFSGLQTTGHGPQVPIKIQFAAENDPIINGSDSWTTENEELYNNSAGKLLDTATKLASGVQMIKDQKGEYQPVETVLIWTNKYAENTKVFATTLGHNNVTVEDPRYLDLITRGLLWSCGKLDDTYLKTSSAK